MSRTGSRLGGGRRAVAVVPLLALGAAALAATPARGGAQRPGAAGAPADTATVRASWKQDRLLRVCADPDNLPFSNRQQEGFENKLAELVAAELGDSLRYVWWPARRGFVRNTLRAGDCDLIIGVPVGFDPVAQTEPYYRSTYFLVYPAARAQRIATLDDPALREVRIGVHFIGEDYTHTPPVHALMKRGIVKNVTGFSTFYGEQHHPGDLFAALERGELDVAVVWGPLAGYFAQRSRVPLTLVPLPDDATSQLPFVFDVAMGVRRSDRELRARLDEILEQRRPDIERILKEYAVPTVTTPPTAARAAAEAAEAAEADDEPARAKPARAAPASASTPRKPAAPPPSAQKPTAQAPSRQQPAAQRPAAQRPAAQRPAAQKPAAQEPAGDRLTVTQSEYNGWKNFAVNCTRCHGDDAIGSALAPSLVKSLQGGTVTHDVFVQTVKHGRPEKGMPPWETLLSEQQIEDLWAYLRARADGRLAPGRPRVRNGG